MKLPVCDDLGAVSCWCWWWFVHCVLSSLLQEKCQHSCRPHFRALHVSVIEPDRDVHLFFQQDSAPPKWSADHVNNCSSDLNPIQNLWDIVKRKIRNPKIQMGWRLLSRNLDFSNSSAVPQANCYMPRDFDRVICHEGAPTKKLSEAGRFFQILFWLVLEICSNNMLDFT